MRILTELGLNRFRSYLRGLREGRQIEPPLEILESENESQSLDVEVEIPLVNSESKFDFACLLLPVVDALDASEIDHEIWPLIWSTLGLSYFTSICPRSADGRFNPRKDEHYIFENNYKLRHRHRIYGPVTLLRSGGEALLHLFGTSPDSLGNFEEQVGSRQELAGSKVALEVLAELYSDREKNTAKRCFDGKDKVGGKKIPRPGTLLRFIALQRQLSRTFDLEQLTKEEFLELLPKEFDRWRGAE